jgi:AraC family carnitine catabolism transcriptional activator
MREENRERISPKAAPAARKVGLLLIPQFSNLGLALVMEPLVLANWLMQRKLFEWTTLSVDGDPVVGTHGMHVPVDAALSDDMEFSAVFVIASFEAKRYAKNRKIKNWLRRQAAFGAELAGIETGAEILAAAGLLDGYSAAIHWDNLEGFQELYPNVNAKDQFYTIERRRLTCAGATSTLDMMLQWIGEREGADLAHEVSQHMQYTQVRYPTDSLLSNANKRPGEASRHVQAAINLMQETVGDPVSCDEIATRVGLSRRQLERLFQHYTSLAPLKYYINLRLARAHKLLQQTDLSVAQVAVGAGYSSLEHFSRVYRDKFGCPPRADRLQSVQAPVMRQAVSPARK